MPSSYKLHRDCCFIDVANDSLEVNLFDTRRLVNSQGKALAILQNILIENDFDRTQFDSKKYKTKK